VAATVETTGLLIGGRWSVARADAVSTNPAHPREEVLRFPIATEAEIDAAVESARRAQHDWKAVPAIERGKVLRRAAALLEDRLEELAVMITRDEGKTLPEARGEVRRAIETLAFHASQVWQPTGEVFASSNPAEEVRTIRVPVGVVAIVTPFNFPLAIPSWKIGPALVHGNAVVWKPPESTPLLGVEFARILQAAGLPDGVLNLVLGPGSVGKALVCHPGIDAVSFTGSVPVGKAIWGEATPRGVKVQLELGGHNAGVVLDDADLNRAARHIVNGAMLAAGQKCTATRRVIVDRSVREPLVERIVALAGSFRVGDGLDEGVDIGPVVSAEARDRVTRAVERATAEGARVVAGGAPLESPELDGGHFFAPTVLEGVTPSMWIAQEEVFGPLTSVIEVAGDDEALAAANSTRFGLSAGVFTRSPERARRFVTELAAGVIHVNNQTTGAEPHVPFRGVRDSGSAGSPPEQGQTARDFYTELKTVYTEGV
jgi:alpha-ketoglutaric semialdehyde dehydrogenase